MPYVLLSLKLVDHKGLALFVHDSLLKRTVLLVLPATLIQILIHALLKAVPVYCSVQSRTFWCCLAAAHRTAAPWHPALGKSVLVLYILQNLHYFS